MLSAVGELLIDSGVSGNDIYIVEALWDDPCYYQFGYSAVQDYLGAQVVNLSVAAPYADFIIKSTGSDYFFQLLRPDGTYCDNHLYLSNQKGLGTNIISEIELVGDGAGSILGINEEDDQIILKMNQ